LIDSSLWATCVWDECLTLLKPNNLPSTSYKTNSCQPLCMIDKQQTMHNNQLFKRHSLTNQTGFPI